MKGGVVTIVLGLAMVAGDAAAASYLYVVYIPYMAPATSGLTANPLAGGPWIMYPGKPWAHIMIAPEKTARITY